MSVRNAGKAIREAREKMGLSQEKFSEGICSAYSLSRIESGMAGVSPSTFQALMDRASIFCESSPVFANRADFDCFYALKHVRFYLDAWRLEDAYIELEKLESLNWAGNRFYYQEWLMLHNRLQFRSGHASHEECSSFLWEALKLTRPEFDIYDFRSCLLSTTEIEVLILLAQAYLYMGQQSLCLAVCSQLYTHLNNMQLSSLEKKRLLAEESIVYAKYLMAIKDYQAAYKVADYHRHRMVLDVEDAPLFELTFLTGLASWQQGDKAAFATAFRNTFYAAHATQSCYATICYQYTKELDASCITEDMEGIEKLELKEFERKKIIDASNFSDGTYNPFSDEIFTVGRLIREFRTEQRLSQTILCQGLCSKSKLSKIENGTLQPDVFLTEALLQRLGISERIFSFWGNEREAEIYELRFQLIHPQFLSKEQIKELLDKFHSNIEKDNAILQQQYLLLYYTAYFLHSESNKDTLYTALECTLPEFKISQISSYRLTWAELTILHNLGFTCPFSEGNIFFYQLLEYMKLDFIDIIFRKSTYSVCLYLYGKTLNRENLYADITRLISVETSDGLFLSLKHWGAFLFFYSQGQAHMENYEAALRYGRYSAAIYEVFEIVSNSKILQKCLADKFSLKI